jgi:hypothetical protein
LGNPTRSNTVYTAFTIGFLGHFKVLLCIINHNRGKEHIPIPKLDHKTFCHALKTIAFFQIKNKKGRMNSSRCYIL